MNIGDIDRLMQSSETPCISIIIPTDRVNKKKNFEVLKKAIQKATALLKSKAVGKDIEDNLIIKLEHIIVHIPENVSDGLGIFVSPSQSTIIALPFEVKLRVIVDKGFEIRDLLYLKQYCSPYYVLNLSKKGAHLYRAMLNDLNEIKDEKFPLLYEDQFEYERASIANSSSSNLKSFERDKNEISEIRLKSVFREADASVKHYLSNDTKLLLAGARKMIALFNDMTDLTSHVAGKISGSYNENSLNKLCESAWETIVRIRQKEISKQIEDVKEKRNGHIAEGLQQAWAAAAEGRGLMLMVEKDLHHRAYRNETENKLHLQPPKKPYEIIPDAIDDLIEIVRSKNGKVVFTDNGQLKAFDHLALVLRY